MRPWVKAALAGLAVVAAFAVGFLIGGGDDGGASVGTGSTLGDTGGLEAAEVSTGEYWGGRGWRSGDEVGADHDRDRGDDHHAFRHDHADSCPGARACRTYPGDSPVIEK